MYEFLKDHQLNIMLFMSGVCAILTLLTILTKTLSPKRKRVLASLEFAESLHMQTLCEGVETKEAVDFLREAGCGRLQGFYYGKPMPYEEILQKIDSGEFRLRAQAE